MSEFKATKYTIKSLCCGETYSDKDWVLDCPNVHKHDHPALIRAIYDKTQIEINSNPGLYKFSDWLPISRTLEGSGSPITYKSKALAEKLGLSDLWITFNGYWPEKEAAMQTGSFKECEAYSVCGRLTNDTNKILVVASAGNTARAFARVCSENNIPLLLSVPEDNLEALWFSKPLNDCVKLIASESGSDYFDAIHLANLACEHDKFFAEGGAKNIARRDGMALTVVSAVTTMGKIPEYYFQAVGSGTGAVAAYEANLRFIEDGRFGNNKMKLMVSQNLPFKPIADAWEADSDVILPLDDDEARKQVEEIDAKVLSNRKPAYCIKGGLYDCMKDAGGDVLLATNEESREASKLFEELEGIDIETAASVAVATLIKAVENNEVPKDASIMLNITGGGAKRFKAEHDIHYLKPMKVFPINPDKEMVHREILHMFESPVEAK